MTKTIIVIGGGAAGYMGAITCAETFPHARVLLLERGAQPLEKVRISGGGRCNVTHACYQPKELVKFYPRGARELLSPFTRFHAEHTVAWFAKRGVRLKTEADGRMFPTTDSSETIVNCLQQAAFRSGVDVQTRVRVENIAPISEGNAHWRVHTSHGDMDAYAVFVAAGSSTAVWAMLKKIGLEIVPPVPSLFTFKIADSRLQGLAGVSLPLATISVPDFKLQADGPLLITHWGLSGPAVLRVSAWGARHLAERQHRFSIRVNFTSYTTTIVLEELEEYKEQHPKRLVAANPLLDIPARLWERLVAAADMPATLKWADISKKQLRALAAQLTEASFEVQGKSTFKEEFVTCGGVALHQIDFKTMQAKAFPHLFFAGEVLDIDAITGGFNFQAAWTCGWIAGKHIAADV